MMTQETRQEEVARTALKEASRLGCDDVSVLCTKLDSSQVRFANNSITLVNNVRDLTLDVYVSKRGRRIIGQSYNPTDSGIMKFIENLVKSCEALPESKDYSPLPQGPFSYKGHANFDSKIEDAPLVEYVKGAIEEGLKAGASRVSGSLNSDVTNLMMLTSTGAMGNDMQSQILINVRAFADDNASGHGLSCASFISEFHPVEAGRRAGDYARRSLNPKQVEEGKYDIVFTPTVVANILPVANSASAFDIESGNSFLGDKLGQKVAVDSLHVDDYGVFQEGLGGRIFDDEGTPTGKNEIVSGGLFKTVLHNSSTAKKFGTKSTGNAGIIAPRPTTIVFNSGSDSFEDIVRETKHGLLITNNWYTRYQNVRTGEYSTVPRDAAFRIEGGIISEPVAGLRVSDSIPRQLMNIEAISKTREWIKWWEVNTPTLAPAMKISGVGITRAVGS
jgi:PmbA protein